MCQSSLIELYRAAKDKPTPCEQFINEVAELTNRSKSTVQKWVIGIAVPDINVRLMLSKHFSTPVEILFPVNDAGHDKQ